MYEFAIIDAPSILGLRSTGVEDLPQAFKEAGFHEKLHAQYVGRLYPSSSYNPERDSKTLLLNAEALREFSEELCRTVSKVLNKKLFPIILGGDCSLLLPPFWHYDNSLEDMDYSLLTVMLIFTSQKPL